MVCHSDIPHAGGFNSQVQLIGQSSNTFLTAEDKRTGVFSFLQLPSEIRNKVYNLYIGTLCIIFCGQRSIRLRKSRTIPIGLGGRRTGWRYFDTDFKHEGVLALLSTCHQLYDEFMSILYRNSTFFFEWRYSFITAFHRNTLGLSSRVILARDIGNQTHPFYRIQALSLNLCSTNELAGRIGLEESQRVTESTMDIVIYNMPSLKHLQLEINFCSKVFQGNRLLQPWFMRQLCKLPKLSYFGIEFAGVTSRTRSDIILDAYHCVFAVNGIINWYFCGMAEKAGFPVVKLFDFESCNNKVIQRWFCREMIVFLGSWRKEKHTRLITLLEEDFRLLR